MRPIYDLLLSNAFDSRYAPRIAHKLNIYSIARQLRASFRLQAMLIEVLDDRAGQSMNILLDQCQSYRGCETILRYIAYIVNCANIKLSCAV